MHAHKHTPLGQSPGGSWGLSVRAASGEHNLWSSNRPGPWQAALASSDCQGARADPTEPFSLSLAACWEAEKSSKFRASEILSLSLLFIIWPFTYSFTSSGHINPCTHPEHTTRCWKERGPKIYPIYFCWNGIICTCAAVFTDWWHQHINKYRDTPHKSCALPFRYFAIYGAMG